MKFTEFVSLSKSPSWKSVTPRMPSNSMLKEKLEDGWNGGRGTGCHFLPIQQNTTTRTAEAQARKTHQWAHAHAIRATCVEGWGGGHQTKQWWAWWEYRVLQDAHFLHRNKKHVNSREVDSESGHPKR